jgi:ribosome maturation factor RimP
VGLPLLIFKKGAIMKNDVEKAVINLVNNLIEDLGYELVDVDYSKDEYGNNLTIFIDGENGIKISDCEKVSRALDEPIEKLNPTGDEQYYFNVSSWGIDKELTRYVDFERKTGTLVELTYLDGGKEKKIEATIKSAKNNEIIFNKKGVLTTVNYNDVVKALPILKF